MNDWLEWTIHCLGIATLATIVSAALLLLSVTVMMVAVKFAPRLHVGKPANDGELCFYDARSGQRRMINAPLGIKWWFGASYRNSPKWFVGIIRWEPKQEA